MATAADTSTPAPPRAPAPGDWLHAADMRHAVVSSTLAEIHLLVDNITSTLGKSLPSIGGLDLPPLGSPPPLSDTPVQELRAAPANPVPPAQWLAYVNCVEWPPQGAADRPAEAEAAARLLLIRDALNQCASPASGPSIAFTLLSVGEDNMEGSPHEYRRLDLARQAFPHLAKPAKYAKAVLFWVIPFAMLLLIGITAYLSVQVAIGTALSSDLSNLRGEVLMARANQAKVVPGDTATPVAKPAPAASAAAPAASAPAVTLPAAPSADAEDRKASLAALETSFKTWGWSSSSPLEASIRLHWLVYILLPLVYSMLGAVTGQCRKLYQHVKENQLMPRHIRLAFLPFVLGSASGAIIGLFYTPTGNDTAGLVTSGFGGSANQFHLSLSALAFLAGFSYEGVYGLLETVIARVFNVGQAASAPAPQAAHTVAPPVAPTAYRPAPTPPVQTPPVPTPPAPVG